MCRSVYRWCTPDQPAAIALLQLPARQELFDRRLPEAVGAARFACLCDDQGAVVDEVVVTRLSQDLLQLACHAGSGQRAHIEAALEKQGLAADPQPAQAFLQEDPSWQDLAQALHPAAVHLYARERAGHQPAEGAWKRYAQRLPRVLITGPCNAGKSSLLNACCGRQRALIDAEPGTTRDLLESETLAFGWRLLLIDSAGLREQAADSVEQSGMELLEGAQAAADCILHCYPGDAALPYPSKDARSIWVCTKADLSPEPSQRADWLAWSAPKYCDARRSAAYIEQLFQAVCQCLGLPLL